MQYKEATKERKCSNALLLGSAVAEAKHRSQRLEDITGDEDGP
jgi:hypothetical protein